MDNKSLKKPQFNCSFFDVKTINRMSKTNPIKRIPFEQQYPYLAYWIEDWGEINTTNGDYGNSRLSLIDEGGDCYQDHDSKSHDEALQKAEK